MASYYFLVRSHGRPTGIAPIRKMIMYEMYPDAWPTEVDQRLQTGPGDKPRRRVRKEHSVIPPVLGRPGAALPSPGPQR